MKRRYENKIKGRDWAMQFELFEKNGVMGPTSTIIEGYDKEISLILLNLMFILDWSSWN
jgi:hypothetical protein